MLNNVFKKSEPVTECIYNSQAGAVVFICAFVFKISSLVGIIAKTLRSSTLWGYLTLTLVELICLTLLYLFFRNGTDEILSIKKSVAYRAGLVLLLVLLLLKALVYLSYALIFITTDLFTEVPAVFLLLTFFFCVVYITTKGIRSIARICEILIIPSLIVILFNLVFLDTELDFGRNLPFLSMEPTEFFADLPVYGLWLGDFIPLIFIRPKNKKLPYFGMGVSFWWILLSVLVGIGIAAYGDMLPLVSRLLIKIAGFNQLSTEIGRLDWTALMVSITMGVTQLAFLFWGAEECSHRIFGSKIYVRIFYLIAISAIIILAPSLQAIANFGINKIVGYTSTAVVIFLSVYFFIIKKRSDRALIKSGGTYVRVSQAESKSMQAELKESKNEA